MPIDLRRYLDLFASESEEQLRSLSAALLSLEGGSAEALESAFRATHTIKGMAATMGFEEPTRLAHAMEDRLSDLRAGRQVASAEIVDELLRHSDALERSVAASLSDPEPPATLEEPGRLHTSDFVPAVSGAGADGSAGGSGAPGSTVPAGAMGAADADQVEPGILRVRVRFSPDTAIPAARALVLRRLIEDVAPVLGSEPAEIDADFAGELTLRLPADTDRAAVEAAAARAGDVASIAFEVGVDRRAPRPEPATGRGASPRQSRLVRIDRGRLDEMAVGIGELAQIRAQIAARLTAEQGSELEELLSRLQRLASDLQRTAIETRMVPISEVFERMPRAVREAARPLGKDVELRLEGTEIQLDRSIIEELAEPLVHLLRNAVDHGIEPAEARLAAGKPARGKLILRAIRERASVRVEVADDGGGVDRERIAAKLRARGEKPGEMTDEVVLRVLSEAGFSTAERVSDVSGRGVGLDAVAARIRGLGGAMTLQSRDGVGTTFSLRLPVTLALTEALRVSVAGEQYAIPLTHVAEVVELADADTVGVGQDRVLAVRGERVPLVSLRARLLAPEAGEDAAAVVVEVGERRAALIVDRLIGHEPIIVKGFDAPVGLLPCFSGVTLLTDGTPALVLDPVSVL